MLTYKINDPILKMQLLMLTMIFWYKNFKGKSYNINSPAKSGKQENDNCQHMLNEFVLSINLRDIGDQI